MTIFAKLQILLSLTCLTTICSANSVLVENKSITTTSTVLMVPPEGFKYNEQTATSNVFQNAAKSSDTTTLAMREFSDMVAALLTNGVNVLVLHQNKNLPDAVFPNNWFSTELNQNGKTDIYIYPMLTQNRRDEVNVKGLKQLLKNSGIRINQIVDMRTNTSNILEGTGSLILDRKNKIIYAALSERTNIELVKSLAVKLNYQPIIFHAVDEHQFPIYHTNVLMGLAEDFAIVCLECIKDKNERNQVEIALKKHGDLIDISQAQLKEMCGNVLALRNNKGQKLLVMSARAKRHFTPQQLGLIQKYNKIVPVQIDTIEQIGGGSARCMMAEIF